VENNYRIKQLKKEEKSMSDMDRRDFLKTVSVVASAAAVTGLSATSAMAQGTSYPSDASKTGNIYEVYALMYETPVRYKLAKALYQQGFDQDFSVNLYTWAAINKKNGEVTLIDTGCAPALGEIFRKANDPGATYTPPWDLVERLGVKPEQVTRVIITHMHSDHCNGMLEFPKRYPKAQFFVQKREVNFWAYDPMVQKPAFKQFLNQEGVDAVVASIKAGRTTVVDGDQFVGPEMQVLLAPGHTPGLQVVVLPTAKGTTIVASDLGHIHRSFSELRPSGIITDIRPWMDSFDKVLPRAPLANIFSGHDAKMDTDYPRVAECITRLA
jgi:glyoxylase-like metal-dependent hydrolase (beta-lactamase superfamily II)